MMSILVGLALIAPVEAISAASKSPKLAKCSGKQRRPANPNGTILPTVDPLTGTSTPADQTPGQKEGPKGVDVFPEPAQPDAKPDQQVPPISSATPPTSYRSC
jgi:hypothetical protein